MTNLKFCRHQEVGKPVRPESDMTKGLKARPVRRSLQVKRIDEAAPSALLFYTEGGN